MFLRTVYFFRRLQATSRRAKALRCFATTTELEPIVLRPYQESCLQACLDAFENGVRRIGVSLPTGSGKTTVFVSLISRLPPRGGHEGANRALIIVNSIELARQSASQVERMFPDMSVEIEQGVKHKASGKADVTVATYQTLLRPERLYKFDPTFLKAIVVDEAHHAAAPSYRRILGHFDPAVSTEITVPPSAEECLSSIPIIGFSATFGRHDGLSLGTVFERIVYHRDFLQMIKDKWLCDVRFTSVRARMNLSQVTINTRTGDFNASSLAHVVNTDTVNTLIVQSWLDRASTRKSTLVFCVNLVHVRDLTNAFRTAGVDARYLHSGTPVIERKALLDCFRRGDFPVLVNCAILTEGADIPNIDCVVIARPTRSRNVFAQMIGRGMRLSPQTAKTDCRIIDFVDSHSRVSGIISMPTLFGLDIDEQIEDETLTSLEERAEKLNNDPVPEFRIQDVPEPTSITYIDYENPFSLVHQATGSPHVAKLSPFAWVACGGDIYVLECLGKGHIRIEPLPGNDIEKGQPAFHGHFTPTAAEGFHTFKVNPSKYAAFRRSRRILTAGNLNDAIRGCDTYAKEHVMNGIMLQGLFRTAKWRKLPPTDGQRKFIMKRWGGDKDNDDDGTPNELPIKTMTRGEAANILTRLKHGAQARYKKKMKDALKKASAMEEVMARRARQVVRVGPLSSHVDRDISSI
ncbi:P-loop containing nucleoside triphosphate hydrolase protein [Hysterangium stoloniferum]|nr:P-loop containing nucleoside triphosphate hydrolase protein [Hysterangium stoloniferum]